MHRVRVAPETLHGTCVTLPPSVVHYVTRVLRLRVGDDIGVFDGRGQEYRVRLTTVSATLVQGKKLATLPPGTTQGGQAGSGGGKML
jgi:16S rRNA U1498 N3-methylase RsmE